MCILSIQQGTIKTPCRDSALWIQAGRVYCPGSSEYRRKSSLHGWQGSLGLEAFTVLETILRVIFPTYWGNLFPQPGCTGQGPEDIHGPCFY